MVLLIMPVNPIIFKVTDVGRDAAAYAFNNLPSGKLSLNTIKVGLAKYSTVGNETALQNPLPNTFSIGGGGVQAGSGQIRFTPILASTTRIEAFEIGLFTDTGILFAIAATPSNNPLLVIEPDIEAIFSMNVALANVDPNSIQIVVDVNAPLAVVMMGQHLSAAHPHSQYKRTLDNSERLKVASAVDNDDAVNKEQLEAEATTRAGVDSALAGQIAQEALDRQAGDTTETASRENGDLALAIALAAEITSRESLERKSPTHQVAAIAAGSYYDLTLVPNEKIRVFMVGGGAEGGRQSTGDFEIVANDGGSSFISNQAQTVFYASAQGGKRGQGGWYEYQGGAVGANGIVTINSTHFEKIQVLMASFDIKPASVPTNAGLGGNGAAAIANHNPGGKGGDGAFMDVIFTNTGVTNLDLRVYAAAVTPSGGYQSSGGQGGFCVLFREPT